MFFTVRPLPYTKKRSFPRIIFAYTDLSASSYYRIQVPATALAEAGYPVGWGPVAMFAELPRASYDMVVISRTGTGTPERVKQALESEQNQGHVLLLDYDDNVLDIPDHNIGKPERTDGIEMAMRTADGLIVTNPTLKKALKAYNPQVGIVPNYIDKTQWEFPKRAEDTDQVKIGLFGTATHVEDWKLVDEALHRIVKDFPNVRVVCGGYQPEYLKDISYLLPWAPLSDYQKMLEGVDIGLCPLIDDAFNRAKSPIKAYEYGMAGCAVVASPVQYHTAVQGRGYTATTPEQWYSALRLYVGNKDKRRGDARYLRQYLLRHIDVRGHASEIAAVYADMYRKAVQRRSPTSAQRK